MHKLLVLMIIIINVMLEIQNDYTCKFRLSYRFSESLIYQLKLH